MIDPKQLFTLGKEALEVEKKYNAMTREQMIKALFELLYHHILLLAEIRAAKTATQEDIGKIETYIFALRKAVEPYEEEYIKMREGAK